MYHPERSSKRDLGPDRFHELVIPVGILLGVALVLSVLSSPVLGATKRGVCRAACEPVLMACAFEAKPKKCRKVTMRLCQKRGIEQCVPEVTTTTTTYTIPDGWVTTTSLAPGQTTTTTLYTRTLCRQDCAEDGAMCVEDMAECHADCEVFPSPGCHEDCAEFETLSGVSCVKDLDECLDLCTMEPLPD